MKNKIKIITYLILSLLILGVTGCAKEEAVNSQLNVAGDIYEVLDISEVWNNNDKKILDYKHGTIKSIEMVKVIEQLKPVYQEFNIYLKAEDGFMIKLNGNDLIDTYLGYSDSDKWVFLSEKHPINSKIKNISELIIGKSSVDTKYDFGLNIIDGDETYNYSVGELYEREFSINLYSEGISNKEYEGKNYSVEVFKERKALRISDLIEKDINSVLIMDAEGNNQYLSNSHGFIEFEQNMVNYVLPKEHKIFADLKGIIINPPTFTIMDVYNDSLHYLKNDKKVMILFVDGLSYNQYEIFKADYSNLNIVSYKDVKKVNTIYKPVTNSGFAAMITGKSPVENGVLNRSYRELNVDTIFDEADKLSKKSVLIEGNIKILNTNIQPVLNVDENGNGMIDDEIYNSALEELNNNDLMLVHFHSFDDFGHNYGPYAEETLNQMKVLDEYIEHLVNKWDGKVFIIADHGMHKEGNGGNHGEFRSEDMFVPYITLNGGKVNE